jgi:hypothetical protein
MGGRLTHGHWEALKAVAIEEAPYRVVKRDGAFELRDYAPHLVAETRVGGAFKGAGTAAFRRLFRYISGENSARERVAMTAPVSQEARGEPIAMTAPVEQQPLEGNWLVSFTMPASYALETLPQPRDPQVTVRQVPARRMAAVRYSGSWSERSFLRHQRALDSWLLELGLATAGPPVWARYNSPFAPWFLRRNEILVPLDEGGG